MKLASLLSLLHQHITTMLALSVLIATITLSGLAVTYWTPTVVDQALRTLVAFRCIKGWFETVGYFSCSSGWTSSSSGGTYTYHP